MNSGKTGNFILQLRREKNMTQKELAQRLHVTDKAVSKWERGGGYPDVTTLPGLAESLGVSVNEILSGERSGSAQFQKKEETAEKETACGPCLRERKKNCGRNLGVVSTLFLISLFVCFLCDFAVSRRLDWFPYAAGGEAVAWSFLAPLLLKKRHALLWSLGALTVLTVPFLLLLDALVPARGVIFPFVFPIVLVGLASFWILAVLFTCTKIRRIFLAAFCVFLVGVVDNLVLDWFCRGYFHQAEANISVPITALSCGFAALLLWSSGLWKRKREDGEASSG